MLKKSLFLMVTLGMVAAVGFGGSADDVEKAQRFRAPEAEAASTDPRASATSTDEKADFEPDDGENQFDLRRRGDNLHVLGSNAQLEELGASYYSSWGYAPRSRPCYMCSYIYICYY